MAELRNPIVLSFPPFAGLTRRLVIVTSVIYLAGLFLSRIGYQLYALLWNDTMLHADQAIGKMPWQLFTYPFVTEFGLMPVVFSLLSLWVFGSMLEGERGRRWLGEYFLCSTMGGALLASLLCRTVFRTVPELGPDARAQGGLWPAVLALVIAFAFFHAEDKITFNFIFRIKAKYLAAFYIVVYFAMAFSSGQRFDGVLALSAALCGFGYLRLAPRQGFRFAASERLYGLRNVFYRNKRKRAAKKFTVYMREQGKEVNFDATGKYVPLDDERRDPTDKRWMN